MIIASPQRTVPINKSRRHVGNWQHYFTQEAPMLGGCKQAQSWLQSMVRCGFRFHILRSMHTVPGSPWQCCLSTVCATVERRTPSTACQQHLSLAVPNNSHGNQAVQSVALLGHPVTALCSLVSLSLSATSASAQQQQPKGGQLILLLSPVTSQ